MLGSLATSCLPPPGLLGSSALSFLLHTLCDACLAVFVKGLVSFTDPLYTNRYLDLSNNQIVAASAPSAISAMSSLTYLDLSNNAIRGSLPSVLATSLAYVESQCHISPCCVSFLSTVWYALPLQVPQRVQQPHAWKYR